MNDLAIIVSKIKQLETEIERLKRVEYPKGTSSFAPILPQAVVINGIAMTSGSTNYTAAGYGVPANAKAVAVVLSAYWGTAGTHSVQVNAAGQTGWSVAVRAAQMGSVYGGDGSGIVPLSANGQFTVARTSNPTQVYLWITGYFS